jgi:hypothetical protein
MALSRLDIQSGVDRLLFYAGWGDLIGLPTRPGSTSAAGTGVPTNGVAGFATGCIFYNFKGGPGTSLYCNIGSNTSAQWINIDSPDGGIVSLTGTVTLSALLHAGRTLLWDLAGGFTATLPAATGSGAIYRFQVQVVSTTGYVLSAAGTDKIKGGILITAAGATAGTGCWFVSTTNANITLNGTTTGGVAIGDYYQVQDVATGLWLVSGGLVTGSGTLATPFS